MYLQVSFSLDSTPPSLEPYENSDSSKIESENSKAVSSNTMESILEVSGDWLVFDQVYGVIPHETAEMWNKQASKADQKRQAVTNRKGERKLPPVRFSIPDESLSLRGSMDEYNTGVIEGTRDDRMT